jgi:surface antigen
MVTSAPTALCLLRVGLLSLCLASVSGRCNAQFGGLFNNGNNNNNNGVGGFINNLANGLNNRLPGHGNSGVSTLLNAAIVGSIGEIAKILNENQARALEQQRQVALSNQPDGARSVWTAPDNSASGTVTTSNTRTETKQVTIVRDASVAEPPPMDLIGKNYVARKTTEVYAAPDGNSAQTSVLTHGSRIWAVGKVIDGPWIMVARHGKSIGYVASGDLYVAPPVRPKPHLALVKTPASSAAAPEQTAASAPTSVDLDDAPPVRSSVDLDKLPPDEKRTVVSASVSCRDVTSTAQSARGSATDTQTVCKSPDGSWDLDAKGS